MRSIFIFLCFIIFAFALPVTAQNNYREGYISITGNHNLFFQAIGNGPHAVIVPAGFLVFNDFKELPAPDQTFIFYDMRNRGRSSFVDDSTQISIDCDVEDLERVRKQFGFEQIDLIGWSYLGLMVMLYTEKHTAHVRKIVQVGPVPIQWNETFPDSVKNKQIPNGDAQRMQFINSMLKENMHLKEPALFTRMMYDSINVYRLLGENSFAPKARSRGSYTSLTNEFYTNAQRHLRIHFGSLQKKIFDKERFAIVKQAVLIIHGTLDRNAPFGGGKQWASILPNSQFIRVPGAGHIPWIEQPDLVFSAIKQFLAK